jgi:hypothetical protein
VLTVAALVMLAAPSAAVAASAKRPCAAEKAAWKKATGKTAKAKAKKRYLACLKRVELQLTTAAIKSQLVNYRFLGTRGDGESVNWLFCPNGKASIRTGNAVSTRDKWGVYSVAGTKKAWSAQIRENANPRAGGWGVGMKLLGSGQYQVGVSRSSGSIESLGNVTRTKDDAACAAL